MAYDIMVGSVVKGESSDPIWPPTWVPGVLNVTLDHNAKEVSSLVRQSESILNRSDSTPSQDPFE